jgi:O-succinylbenzoic acid--CoA ligase
MSESSSSKAGINLVFKEFSVEAKALDSLNRNLSEFEQGVIDFAREWLSGKSTFEFQTSGSTGAPQKIKFNRSQIEASAKLTRQTFKLEKNQTALLCLDPEFIAGKMMIVRALEIGMDLVCIPPSANPLVELTNSTIIHFAAFVPYQLNTILNSSSSTGKLSQIKKVIVGGSQVQDNLIQKIHYLSTEFFETYGMTETLTHIAIRKLNLPENSFKTLPGVKVFLDERQCLNVQAEHLGDPIRTNDLAEITSKGIFKIIGRYDNIINTGGAKVSPEDIERKIASIMNTNLNGSEYFIGSMPDKTFGERVVLFIEGRGIDTNVIALLIELMRPALKKWEAPKEIITIPTFRRTDSGKVNRKSTIHLAR